MDVAGQVKIAFYMNCVSAHQLPLARRVAEQVGVENFSYVDARDGSGEGYQLGAEKYEWITRDTSVLETADLVLSGLRDIELFERRRKKGLKTFYTSERWFKPIHGLPGWLRMLSPGYRRMVKRFVAWANSDENASVLAIGPWAKRDFLRMGVSEERLVPWGYFVEPSVGGGSSRAERTEPLKVLWVGRMLKLKRVDTLITAVSEVGKNIVVTLVGDGPEKNKLERMAKGMPVNFFPSMSNEQIRCAMRENDVFVFPSNGVEGWGVVVSESLEEGLRVLGTYEAGAPATMLEESDLFHAGDWKRLAEMLMCCVEEKRKGCLMGQGIGRWSVDAAARQLISISRNMVC